MRIGVDLGGTKIEGILLSDTGEVAEKIRIATPGGNYRETVESVCDTINQLQSRSASHNCTIGIGTPGALTAAESDGPDVMKNCNSICLNGEPLKADIENQLGREVRIENDANCFALSEACYGAGASARTVFGVILGTGTGGGIVIDKGLHTGPNRIAGEWGHNCIPSSVRELIKQDRRCYCGRENCVETVLSGRGLTQTHLEGTGIESDAAEIARLTEQGDDTAKQSIATYAKQLARCLSTVVNLLDPDVIVLGGGLSNIASLYSQVPEELRAQVFTDQMLTELKPPRFGDASGAIGAACLWPLT